MCVIKKLDLKAVTHTAQVSVATAVITNKRVKVTMNSSAKAWPVLTAGTVTPPDMNGSMEYSLESEGSTNGSRNLSR
jgi:hypothetical protein